MNAIYKKGKCPYCGEEFERPYKFKTETEGFHIKECELKDLKDNLKNITNTFSRYMHIDKLENLSKRFSFGAKKGNKAYGYMLEIKKIIEIIEGDEE